MGYDARNFFLNVFIVSADESSRLPLWLWEEDTDDEAVMEAFDLDLVQRGLPIVQDVTIEQKKGGYFSLSATLAPTFNQAISLLDSKFLELGNILEVEFGYLGDPVVKSPLYRGVMELPEIQLGAETTITLKTGAIAGMSAARQTSSREPFNDMSRLDIMAAVLAGGDPPRAAQIYYGHVEKNAPKSWEKLNKKVTRNQGSLSDWFFIQQLCQESQCICYILRVEADGKEEDWVMLKGKEDIGAQKPKRTFRLMPGFGYFEPGEGGFFPIFTVSSSTTGIFMPGDVARGVLASSIDDETREQKTEREILAQRLDEVEGVKDEEINPRLFGVKASGQKGGGAPKPSPTYPGSADGSGGRTSFRDPSRGGNRDRTAGELVEKAPQGTINLTIESIGVPDLEPGDLNVVEGLGKRYSGNYEVLQHTHGISSSGPVTTMEMIRNAHMLGDERVEEKGQVNVQEAEAAEGGSSTTQQSRDVT